jgi:hypothetical protein
MTKEKRIFDFEFSLGLYREGTRHIIVSRFFDSKDNVIHLDGQDIYGIEKIISEELKSQELKKTKMLSNTETVLSFNVRRRINEGEYKLLLDTDLNVGSLSNRIRFNINVKNVLGDIINILRNGYDNK